MPTRQPAWQVSRRDGAGQVQLFQAEPGQQQDDDSDDRSRPRSNAA